MKLSPRWQMFNIQPVLIEASRAAAFVFLLSIIAPYAHSGENQKRLDMQPVSKSVYMLSGSGGNIGLLTGADGWVMVDSQFGNSSDAIRAELDRISTAPLRFLVNTHWHSDHTDGNLYFAHAGATIIASDNAAKRLSSPQIIRAFHKKVDALPAAARPIITTHGQLSLHLNKQDILLQAYPHAHTDGDLIVWFKQANVIHLGDIYFEGQFPFIDRSSGGSVTGMINAVGAILEQIPADIRIIPGHGKLSDTAGLSAYYEMLIDAKNSVKTYTDQHKNLAEIKKQKPLAHLVSRWGNGFIKQDAFVEALFDELAR